MEHRARRADERHETQRRDRATARRRDDKASPPEQEDDDRRLAERAAVDPEAFAALYRRYVGPIYRFAYRRSRSREVAEDVTSAAFEKALRSMERFEWRRGGFRAWMYRIAANELTDAYRRERRDASPRARGGLRALTPVVGFEGCGLDGSAVDASDDAARLVTALAALSSRYQQVISLRYMAELEPAEAADALGCTRATLAVVLHRAMGALRRELERLPTGEGWRP